MDEKEQLERKALAYFLRLYNRKNHSKYCIVEKRERPDFLIKNQYDYTILGIEISHIFHDKKEAMMLLGRDMSHVHGIITATDHVDVLTRILKKKSEKQKMYPYQGPTLLVLRDFSPIFDANMLFDARSGLKVPASKYEEIWYVHRSHPVDKWDGLVQLA